MARPVNDDLIKQWKLTLPATTAGTVEHLLMDQVLGKPKYSARADLTTALLNWWIARETGRELPPIPTAAELLSRKVAA